MLVADTSVLFALLHGSDAHHAKAVAEAKRERPFVIPSEILGEVIGLVRHRHGTEASRAALGALRGIPHAQIAASKQSVVEQALDSATRGPLSYQDWIVIHRCRATGAQPWTFDDAIRRAVKA